jgi:hypothetical protein
MSYSYTYFLPSCESQTVIFLWVRTQKVGILNQILQDTATKLLKTHKNQPDPYQYAFMVCWRDNFTFLLYFLAKQNITVHESM